MDSAEIMSRINRLRNLDYRRYRKLTPKERKIYTNNESSITVKSLALKYKAITKSSIQNSLEWANKHIKRYNRYVGANFSSYRLEKNSEYLEQEFIFRGYVPRERYHKKANYNYIESNQPINGTYYIYPQPGFKGLNAKGWNSGKYPYIYKLHSDVGIIGYTRVDNKYPH